MKTNVSMLFKAKRGPILAIGKCLQKETLLGNNQIQYQHITTASNTRRSWKEFYQSLNQSDYRIHKRY